MSLLKYRFFENRLIHFRDWDRRHIFHDRWGPMKPYAITDHTYHGRWGPLTKIRGEHKFIAYSNISGACITCCGGCIEYH